MIIATIIGARPQFIKAAPVSRAVRAAAAAGADISEILIHTGQHYDDNMSAVFFAELGIPEPSINLGIGSGPHGAQTGAMLAGIERILGKKRPDCVLVYGDTNSTLAGALAAAKMHIPIAHVEAGLRSRDRRMPEEINRVVADRLSTLLFCPSRAAMANLAKEGIRDGVHVVGDVMAEALREAVALAKMREAHGGTKGAGSAGGAGGKADFGLARLGLEEGGYLLATVHRAENTDDPVRLKGILDALETFARQQPVIFPFHPRTRKKIAAAGWKPGREAMGAGADGGAGRAAGGKNAGRKGGRTGIRFVDPLGHLEMARLESGAAMILTDSGGVQKEAYWLKIPCVTLRERTEWIETVAAGWNILAGADTRKIIRAVRDFHRPRKHVPLYGSASRGQAASARIVALVRKSIAG